MNLCHRANFSAENTPIIIVPEFTLDDPMPFLSWNNAAAPSMHAGVAVEVPLWMAKSLYQRHLCKLEVPVWLTDPQFLQDQLVTEQEQAEFSTQLDFYYFEIAQALQGCRRYQSNGSASATSTGGGGDSLVSNACQVLLQDLVQMRLDKMRIQFGEMSQNDMQQGREDLERINVKGICSVELSILGPFLKTAFTEYGRLAGSKDEGKTASGKESITETVQRAARARTTNRLRRFREPTKAAAAAATAVSTGKAGTTSSSDQ